MSLGPRAQSSGLWAQRLGRGGRGSGRLGVWSFGLGFGGSEAGARCSARRLRLEMGPGSSTELGVIECRLGVCGWGLGFRARSSGLWAGEQGLGAWLRALGAWASGLALGARSQGTRRSVFKAHSSRLRVWGWRLGIQGLRRERGHGRGCGVVWMRAWEWRWA